MTVLEVLQAKIRDLSDFTSEVYDENITLVDAIKEIKDKITLKDKENQVLTSDNKQLSLQIHGMISKKTFSRCQQTEIDVEEMEIFDEIKEKCSKMEDEVDSLIKKLREKDRVNAKI